MRAWLSIFGLLLAASAIHGDAVTVPRTGFAEVEAGKVFILSDPGVDSVEEITKREKDFKPATTLDLLDPGKVYWAYFDIVNPDPGMPVLEARSDLLHRIDLYFEQDGRMVQKSAGISLPFMQREIAYRYSAFRLPMKPTIRVYLRLEFQIRQHMSLKLWNEKWFTQKNRREQLILGVYYGIVIAMAVYNLFVFLSLRSVSYMHYVLYIISFALYQTTLNGISFEYFWPQTAGLDIKASFVSAGLSIMFAALFARHFLGVEKRSRFFNFAFLGSAALAGLWAAASLILPFQTANVMGRVLGSLVVPLIIAGSIWALRDGYKPARYFLIAWTFLLIGVLMFSLTGLGVLPWNPATRYSMQLGSVVEILLLSLALGDRINSLREQKDAAVTRTRELTAELQIAKRIQSSILPESNPQIEGLRIESAYRPASEVGGDFYDFHTEGKMVGLIVADVCGHGVGAALIASMVKISFANLRSHWKEPDEILRGLHRSMSPRIRGQFITACYAFVDMNMRRLYFSSAGHPPVLIWRRREKRLHELGMRGPVIGWPGDWTCPSVSWDLEPGDRLVLYTDGIFEQRNQKGEMFGFDRFYESISATSELTTKDAADAILSAVDSWHKKEDQLEDDVTLILLDIE
ncbi:MAG TPA: 7TM diverse intracellular signaling domain-containing protein [Leptospiraceae bacterium]|nr:SpoIIE family protein phosphatase [Leptospirales bacterium]HMU82695.1 7TM diverse intracellular signaling domain-containing protein [Leptospiraceae bacterium]HMX57041.1 7TM diverse intracellular signaling domain-containing protein [Leptospiraceae bacterium]HMY46171.1 7TM diverse intracellular signaling domain-containing protein [Leptospiraceae bacterium]HMZ35524.1 7TM diverse intracellular signaling domain-containing protein [Leptospiraceae bacterium]